MFSADAALLAMYMIGFSCTRMKAFLYFIPAMLASAYVGWALVDSFPSEYLYFLTQSMIWLLPSIAARNSIRVSLSALTMSLYSWIVSIESFIWQYISPVETPMHTYYSYFIMAIHLLIISNTAKWGGEIGYITWRNRNRIFANSDL